MQATLVLDQALVICLIGIRVGKGRYIGEDAGASMDGSTCSGAVVGGLGVQYGGGANIGPLDRAGPVVTRGYRR